ncbi:MAG: hypothetical protein QXU52_00435 [Fervidicoccaceae archaeon]
MRRARIHGRGLVNPLRRGGPALPAICGSLAALRLDARDALEALASSAILHSAFVDGALMLRELGLGRQAESVYGRFAGSAAKMILAPVVGVAEEIY